MGLFQAGIFTMNKHGIKRDYPKRAQQYRVGRMGGGGVIVNGTGHH